MSASRSRSRTGDPRRSRSRSRTGSGSRDRHTRSRSYSRSNSRSDSSRSSSADNNNEQSHVVFIRNLDERVKKQDLKDHFAECGQILSASVIKDRRTRRPKGFGFVGFGNEEAQDKAGKLKDGSLLFDKYIVVQKSTRKTTIYIGNLPFNYDPDKDETELREIIEERCRRKVQSFRSKGTFAFCEFINFEHTQSALQKLPGLRWRENTLKIQLAHTAAHEEKKMNEERQEELKRTLFVRNISVKATEKDMRSKFEKYGEITRCEIIRDRHGNQRDYGFIGYKEKTGADKAYQDAHKSLIAGKEINIEFAKPKQNARKREKSPGGHSRHSDRDDHRRSGRSRERSSRGGSSRGADGATRVEIEDVLNRGVPVMVWDASVRRYVLLTPEEYYNKYDDRNGRRSPREDRGSGRYRDDYGRSRKRY